MVQVWLHDARSVATPSRVTLVAELAAAGVEIREQVDAQTPGIVLFDSPDAALGVVHERSQGGVRRVLAVASSHAALTGDAAWRLRRAGAADVIALDRPLKSEEQIAARLERWVAVDRLLLAPVVRDNLVGRSRAWVALLRQVIEAAAFSDSSVLLIGESGTGKELLARLIHTLDPRPDKGELVVLDCTTVVPELSGSEFFGHERGAFTGAAGPRDGAFALADGGTLFLDEVGELPPGLQAQLLRVVQERTYKRVGGNSWQRTRFRLVCATNRDLHAQIEQGGFRRDFFHRIAACCCRVPPLSERREDILPLVRHMFQQLRPGADPPELDEPVREYLQRRAYPGNVRDLRQLVVRLHQRYVGRGPITVGAVPDDELPPDMPVPPRPEDSLEGAVRSAIANGMGLKDIGRAATEAAIRVAMAEEDGSLQRAARRLGVTDRALQIRRRQALDD